MPKSSTQRPLIDTVFRNRGINPNIFLETANNTTRLSLIRNGIAFSIIPEAYAIRDENIRYFFIDDHPILKIVIAYKKGCYLNQACKDLIQLVKEYWISYPYFKVKT